MQTNLLWTGREYYSLENCLVKVTNKEAEITSVIIGHYKEIIYSVEYVIKTNQNWETIFFKIFCRHSDQTQSITFEGDGKGNWLSNDRQADQFKGCIDIDIPLTPFTNTFHSGASVPIRITKLKRNIFGITGAISILPVCNRVLNIIQGGKVGLIALLSPKKRGRPCINCMASFTQKSYRVCNYYIVCIFIERQKFFHKLPLAVIFFDTPILK